MSDTMRDRIAAALREEDHHSCMHQEGIDADALADTVLRVVQPELTATTTCGESIADTGFFGNQTLGPCILRAGHDGPVHQAANRAKWWSTGDGIVNIPEPMTEAQFDAIRTAWNEHYGHTLADPSQTIARLSEELAFEKEQREDLRNRLKATSDAWGEVTDQLDALRAVLREVLGTFREVTNSTPERDVLGYSGATIHPDDYDRWAAALDGGRSASGGIVHPAVVGETGPDCGPLSSMRYPACEEGRHTAHPGATCDEEEADRARMMTTLDRMYEDAVRFTNHAVPADVPPALRSPNCPRVPDDPEPLRRLAEQALAQPTVRHDPRANDPAYHPITGYRTWAEVEADPPKFTGLISPSAEQCRAEFHHPTMQSARCDLPAGHAQALHREQRDRDRVAFRWDESVAMYPTDTTTEQS